MDESDLFVLSDSDDGEDHLEQKTATNRVIIGEDIRNTFGDASEVQEDFLEHRQMSMEEVLFGATPQESASLRASSLLINDSNIETLGAHPNAHEALGTDLQQSHPEVDYIALHGMTCADVREVLEPFFNRKEAFLEHFNRARIRLMEKVYPDHIHVVSGKKNGSTLAMQVDRWRRLVNISNWGDGTSRVSDVLFPDVLVPAAQELLSAAPSSTRPGPTKQLRPHQLDGIRFMWSVLAEGPVARVPAVGCILAHTMGLGKTCQVVVFLHLFMRVNPRRRVLIVVPKSTRSGWFAEFEAWSRFFPSAERIVPLIIDERESRKRRTDLFCHWAHAGGVLLVGYEALLGLTQHCMPKMEHWKCTDLVICDEAHRLKSTNLLIVTALRKMRPLRRLLLTGTPLQNHLEEYWAMVDFALHKYFEKRRFRDFFINPIEASVDRQATKEEVAEARMKIFTLSCELRHFVQRVDSFPLQHELPPLHEYVLVVPLSSLQEKLYVQFLRMIGSQQQDRFNFLEAVTYANKISSHPKLLFDSDPTVAPVQALREVIESSSSSSHSSSSDTVNDTNRNTRNGKIAVDREEEEKEEDESDVMEEDKFRGRRPAFYKSFADLCLAPNGYTAAPEDGSKLFLAASIIKAATLRGEHTLFFSHSTKLLDLFEWVLRETSRSWRRDGSLPRPIRHCRLDGSSTSAEREAALRSFGGPDGADVFLLSTRAGGVGITITAASRVIIADSGFNPADDRQAIGRAYRYGQTRPVYVYRLICHRTFEHHIFEQKLAKEWLFRTVVEEASLKRDALAGLRLRSMFQLLDRSTRARGSASSSTLSSSSSSLPVSSAQLTEKQRTATARLVAADAVLSSVAGLILYAESHEVFLEHDEQVRSGEEERAFYADYQRSRVFSLTAAERAAGEDSDVRRRRREEHRNDVAGQASSLAALVDGIIRTRAADDPLLRNLLRVMGVGVADKKGGEGMGGKERRGESETREPPRKQQSFLLLDEEEEEEEEEGVELVRPALYEPFRPGRDAENAIDVDDDI